MNPPRIMETARLRLTPPVLEDAEEIFASYAQDPEVTRYLVWMPHESIETTREFLFRCMAVWALETAFPWVIRRKGDERLLGMIEIRMDGYRADLGYALARPYWGQGIMTEAIRAVVDWAISQEEIYRVWAVCDVDNKASARVLEKAGMQREGILHRWGLHPNISEVPRDCFCYAKVK